MTVIIMLTLYCVYWVISVLAPWCCRTWGFCYHLLSGFYNLTFVTFLGCPKCQNIHSIRVFPSLNLLPSCSDIGVSFQEGQQSCNFSPPLCPEGAPCICGFVRCRTSRALSCTLILAVRFQSANTFPGRTRTIVILSYYQNRFSRLGIFYLDNMLMRRLLYLPVLRQLRLSGSCLLILSLSFCSLCFLLLARSARFPYT